MSNQRSKPKTMTVTTEGIKTWKEIKQQIEEAGITDTDPVFLIDIGPTKDRIWVAKDKSGQVEIADDPTLLLGNNSD